MQELAQLIEEANQSLEESGTPSHEILVVVLHREVVAHGSIGITLAGGADYEAKEITVSFPSFLHQCYIKVTRRKPPVGMRRRPRLQVRGASNSGHVHVD